MLQVKTQQHKSINLRTLVTNLQNGLPVPNYHTHEVFDLDSEPEFDSQVADDFSDKLEILEAHRMLSEEISEQINEHYKQNSKKTKSSEAANTPPPASEASHESVEAN